MKRNVAAIGAKIESGVMPRHSKASRNFEAIWPVGAQTTLKRIPLKVARKRELRTGRISEKWRFV
jgi:hypothetical protein